MPRTPEYTYVLPGQRLSPKAQLKVELAKAFAFSRTCNPRNLESHWYGLWCKVLIDLVEDRLRLQVIPQFVIYYKRPDADVTAIDNTDKGDDEPNFADTSFDTVVSIASTLPDRNALEVIPDFSIIRIAYRRREDHEHFRRWNHIKTIYAGIPVIIEVKRCVKRTPDVSADDAEERILEAQADVEKQAVYLFRGHARQKSVVLLACSAYWWSYRVIRADQLEDEDGDPLFSDFSREPDEDVGLADTHVEDLREGPWDAEANSDDELDIMSLPEGPSAIEKDDVEIPWNDWSNIVPLGSRSSNSRFATLHQHLEDVLVDNTGVMG